MAVGDNLILKWTTKNELGKLPFVVEQYRWNKWVKLDEIEGQGTPTENNYSYKVIPHSGKNQYRVKQVDYSGQARISKTVDYMSGISEISFTPSKVTKDITSLTKIIIYLIIFIKYFRKI